MFVPSRKPTELRSWQQSACLTPLFLMNLWCFGTSALAEAQSTTRPNAIACSTLEGLEAFWLGVDQRPASISYSDFKAELGCVSLSTSSAVIPLQEIVGAVIAVKAKVAVGDQLYDVWLAESDIRTSD